MYLRVFCRCLSLCVQERNILAAMGNAAPDTLYEAQEAWMPSVLGVMQDDRLVHVSSECILA
jgi:hypothetical protein